MKKGLPALLILAALFSACQKQAADLVLTNAQVFTLEESRNLNITVLSQDGGIVEDAHLKIRERSLQNFLPVRKESAPLQKVERSGEGILSVELAPGSYEYRVTASIYSKGCRPGNAPSTSEYCRGLQANSDF